MCRYQPRIADKINQLMAQSHLAASRAPCRLCSGEGPPLRLLLGDVRVLLSCRHIRHGLSICWVCSIWLPCRC